MKHDASESGLLNLKSLRQQVYDYLRISMNRGELTPGATLNLNQISQKLGVSRTPLREALLQLEIEGFITILPRRGCRVKRLTRQDIRNLYQIIGALESSVITDEFHQITPSIIRKMERFNADMRSALDGDDFDAYYEANLRMHNCYLDLSSNAELRHIVDIMKQRLYDFPRKHAFVKEWEIHSTREHEEFIRILEAGDSEAAARYIRDVHWSFEVQEPYIEQYYLPELESTEMD
ncbi:MAG: GntR family transcriptional regulator [Anaerolineales bacterium]